MSEKRILPAILLCFFIGVFGIHRFYIGKWPTAILYLFTGGLFGIGWLYDCIMLVCGYLRDGQGYYIKEWV